MTQVHSSDTDNKYRRWQLILGADESGALPALNKEDRHLAEILATLYDQAPQGSGKRRGTLARSAPKAAKWLGDIRRYFPVSVVQVIQQDAFERLGLKEMLLEPEFLAVMQADVHLAADLISLREVMPAQTLDSARMVVAKLVDELLQRFARHTVQTLRGALNKSQRTRRPRSADIDWARTIAANLRHYQAQYKTVIPERLVGFLRHSRQQHLKEEVILCVDQSGSMASSVVYSSVFAAVLASIPALKTGLVCFDTVVNDLSDMLDDPVKVLFGIQLGGGTDIGQALAYCQQKITQPAKTHLVLISDLYEGGNQQQLLARAASLLRQGVNIIVLLALSDDGHPAYHARIAKALAGMGIAVFSCTPDKFPGLMACALKREDIAAWAANADINTVRGDGTGGIT